MKIAGSVALVTGADRGPGRAFARELVSRNAARVWNCSADSDFSYTRARPSAILL
jgi:NAD(P)-dependent dehydrogenase (short-subunit alcohol dehydrogenase family)